MISAAYRLARMDFGWAGIEKQQGVYDFSAYDGLLATMEQHKIRPYWILDYGNPLYPPIVVGPDCTTPATCTAQCPGYFGNCSDGTWYCCGGVMRTPSGGEQCNVHHLCPTNPKLAGCACIPPAGPADVRTNSSSSSQGNGGCNTPECIAAFGLFATATISRVTTSSSSASMSRTACE